MDPNLLKILNHTLADLYQSKDEARRITEFSSLDPKKIDITGAPITFWFNILKEAEKQNSLYKLLDTVIVEYPKQPDILVARKALEEGFEENYSLIQGNYMEFGILPIAFLELGVHKVKSICRVIVRNPSNEPVLSGTGFLIKSDLLITVNFLIPDKVIAQNCIIEFEYEQSLKNSTHTPTQLTLDPESFFFSSESYPCTIVRIKDKPSNRYPSLNLRKTISKKGASIIIVHHPTAGFKQISMRDGPITYIDEETIRYKRTIKTPGSAGAPIFNLSWQLIGMHYSGATLNGVNMGEAISVNKIIEVLEDAGKAFSSQA